MGNGTNRTITVPDVNRRKTLPVSRQRDVRWRLTILWAVIGTFVTTVGVLLPVLDNAEPDPLLLIYPGSDGPSAEVFREDFPDIDFPTDGGHDGQQVYAVARNPWHLEEVAQHLDRPTYRLGRPLLSWLGWLAHPWGGGPGLAWTLIALGVVATFAFGLAGGALVQLLGGPPQAAVLFPLLPGTIATLSITTADVLATALLAGAIAAIIARRYAAAAALGALAILAKEPMALPLGVFLLGRIVVRRRTGSSPRELTRSPEALIGIASIGPWVAWSAWIRWQLGAETRIIEFGPPFLGLVHGWEMVWSDGQHLLGLTVVIVTYALSILALVRGWRRPDLRPLWLALLGQLIFTTTFGVNVIALNYNGPRTTLPLLVLAIAVATGATRPSPVAEAKETAFTQPRPTRA